MANAGNADSTTNEDKRLEHDSEIDQGNKCMGVDTSLILRRNRTSNEKKMEQATSKSVQRPGWGATAPFTGLSQAP